MYKDIQVDMVVNLWEAVVEDLEVVEDLKDLLVAVVLAVVMMIDLID